LNFSFPILTAAILAGLSFGNLNAVFTVISFPVFGFFTFSLYHLSLLSALSLALAISSLDGCQVLPEPLNPPLQ